MKLFYDEAGMSTAGMVLALLIALSLIFSSAQVYQINAASATVQNVADAAALAAENEVAEFYVVARVCDAIVLSLSLTGVAAIGLGVVALCTPVTSTLSKKLIETGTDIIKARNNFAERTSKGLNRLQKLLPFISAANAESVIMSNSGGPMNASYGGIAILLPFEGEEISVGPLEAADGFIHDVEDSQDELGQAVEEAEEAAREAKESKERAFLHDCGNDPGYCMYERAGHLAGLGGYDNPLYRSMETWNFSVALKRAQAYYPQRIKIEAPIGQSVEAQADSQLRKRFYAFASQELAKGYVNDDGAGGFEAYFPLLPKNTVEMRATVLYTEAIYPITEDDGNPMMHAWAGCPEASSGASSGAGSLAQLDRGGFVLCPQCRFSVSGFGKIAAASSSIENGFEYHYRIVAESAATYAKAQREYKPHADKAKELTDGLLGKAKEAFSQAVSYRIRVSPPGRTGAIAIVVNTQDISASHTFFSRFVQSDATLGAQAAISASTLAGDSSEEDATIISSLLDGVSHDSGNLGVGIADTVLDLWSFLLSAYTKGQAALVEGIEHALDRVPLASESGLGTWAAGALSDVVESIGFEPVELASPKPVLVNSAHVLEADGSRFAANLLEVKRKYLAIEGQGSGSLFSTAVSQLESYAIESVEGLGDGIVISSIELIDGVGPAIPVTIALPPSVKAAGQGFIHEVAEALRSLEASVTGIRRWE